MKFQHTGFFVRSYRVSISNPGRVYLPDFAVRFNRFNEYRNGDDPLLDTNSADCRNSTDSCVASELVDMRTCDNSVIDYFAQSLPLVAGKSGL